MKYDPIIGWIITLKEWEQLGLSKDQYNILKHRHQLKTNGRPAKGKPIGIIVSSLPDKYRTIIEQRMVQLQHDHSELMVDAKLQGANLTHAAIGVTANTLLVNAPYIAGELSSHMGKEYEKYLSHYLQGYCLSRRSVVGYAKLCAIATWIYGIVELLRSGYPNERDFNRHMRSFRANLQEAMQQLAADLEVTPPLSKRLDQWVDYVVTQLDGGTSVTDIVVPKRSGNRNAQQVTEQQLLAIERLYSDPAALSIMEIYNKLVELGRLQGWWRDAAGNYNPPSYDTIRRYILERKNTLKLVRKGMVDYRNNIVPTINRKYPDKKNMVWGIDGTAQNEYVHYRGKVRQYAYAITVYDYATFRLLNVGISLGPDETAENMIQALKGAIKEAGYKPYVLQCDQGPAFTGLKKWCSDNGIKVIPAGLGVARAKPVELLIGLKDRLVDRFNAGWSGGNRTALGDNSQPGDEHVKRAQRNARDFAIAKNSIAFEVMQQWNNYVISTREGKPCNKTPNELWNELESYTPKLDAILLALTAGVKHSVKLTIDGLTIANNGNKYTYFPPLDNEKDIDVAYEVFSSIPRSGHPKGAQLDIYVLDYGKPAPVFKGNTYYGMWEVKPRVDMFATITGDTAYYNKLRAFQQHYIDRGKQHLSQLEQQYQTQPYAPMLDELKQQPLTGRKRVVPMLDKANLNAEEIMAKSSTEHPDALEALTTELEPAKTDDEYEIREYINIYTGEVITHKIAKHENKND